MRYAIVALQEALDHIKALREQKVAQYLSTDPDIIYISDHAKVRYLERIEHIKLYGHNDKERLRSACANTKGLEERMLSIEERRMIVKEGLSEYTRGNARFVIKNLKAVTVTRA